MPIIAAEHDEVVNTIRLNLPSWSLRPQVHEIEQHYRSIRHVVTATFHSQSRHSFIPLGTAALRSGCDMVLFNPPQGSVRTRVVCLLDFVELIRFLLDFCAFETQQCPVQSAL